MTATQNFSTLFPPELLSSNNLADVKSPSTAITNIGGVSFSASQALTPAQQVQALSNIGAPTRGQVVALALGTSF